MGVLLIVLAFACAGAMADFVIENHLASATGESFALAGGRVQLSAPSVALIAFGLGALAVLLAAAGVRHARRRRVVRHDLKQRVADLESENALLRGEPPDTTGPDAWTTEQVRAARIER